MAQVQALKPNDEKEIKIDQKKNEKNKRHQVKDFARCNLVIREKLNIASDRKVI